MAWNYNVDFINEQWSPELAQVANQIQLDIVRFSHYRGDNVSWKLPAEQRRAFHNHLYWELEGDGELELAGEAMPLAGGHTYLIGTKCEVGLRCKSKVERYYCVFSCKLPLGMELLGYLERPVRLGLWSQADLDFFKGLDAAGSMTLEDALRLRGMILIRLQSLKPGLSEAVAFQLGIYTKYRRMIDFVSDNLGAGLKLPQLAALMKTTEHLLSRNYKKDTGISLKKYLNQRLFSKATEMLMDNRRYVKEVAALLGFRDEYYFNRFFKKMAKVSPGAYREGVRSCGQPDGQRP